MAAYDQRGCLSPLVVWVVDGASVGLEEFAELVFAELERLRTKLPRGTLPIDVASAQLSWRGVGAMRGRLLEGEGFSVCCEERGTLRLSPGYRNLQILGVDDASQLPAKLAPLGVHLKTLGPGRRRRLELAAAHAATESRAPTVRCRRHADTSSSRAPRWPTRVGRPTQMG